jgi:hypothetical protein
MKELELLKLNLMITVADLGKWTTPWLHACKQLKNGKETKDLF